MALLAVCAVSVASSSASAATGVVVESVKDYTLLDPTGNSDIPNAHVEADGLWS